MSDSQPTDSQPTDSQPTDSQPTDSQPTPPNWVNRIFDFLVVLVLILLFPYIAFKTADYLGYLFNYSQFSLPWDYVHHIVQMLLALFVILLTIKKKPLTDWGFNFKKSKWTLKTVGKFCVGYIIFLFIGKLIYLWILHWPPILDFDLSANTLVGKLLFRFTMPGLSEEILFRALAMGILMRSWKGHIRLGKLEIPIAGLIASIFFCIAHIGFSFSPFKVTFDPMQLVFAFVFGIFYSILLDRTNSLLGPILAHNAIDGFGTIIDVLLSLISP